MHWCYVVLCRMAEVTSLTAADDVIGRSLYQFCHVNDVATLRHAHVEGELRSSFYSITLYNSCSVASPQPR